MKLGYNWIKGPFELIDEIGVDRFIAKLETSHQSIPVFLAEAAGSSFYRSENNQLQARGSGHCWQPIRRPHGVIRFSEKRQTLPARNRCQVASWYDLDAIALVEFHSKANALDADSMAMLDEAIDCVARDGMRGLILHNDAQHFSCGVNLQAVREFFLRDDLDGLDGFLHTFQSTVHRLQTAEFPVVAAPSGMSIGGGFEVVLHARQVICHANSVTGLVESLVGLVPGGGGCKETLYRWVELLECGEDITPACWRAFMNLGYGKTASSPVIAQQQAMLRANDGFVNNRDRLLAAALNAIDDPTGQLAFERPALPVPGRPVFTEMVKWLEQARDQGKIMPHDAVVGTELARIVSGGDVDPGTGHSEQDFYAAERRAFLSLVDMPATRERINSMLDAGSPVRN